MKAFIDGFFSQIFNGEAERENLTVQLTQAFYRRDHQTVDLLASQGAEYNEEMLEVAVAHKDERLIKRCFAGGVKPSDELICRTVDKQDAPLVQLLVSHADISPKLHSYIDTHASDAVKDAVNSGTQRKATLSAFSLN